MRVRFLQKPGQELEFRITFNCANENAVKLIDVASGNVLFDANSHFGGLRSYICGTNTGNHPIVLELEGIHKNTPPDGRQPWHPSNARTNASGDYLAVGYEDAGDNDFNDALVTVTASPTGLGIGFPT